MRWLALALIVAATSAFAQDSGELTLDQLVGTWSMSYDMGQGAQTGTIVISEEDGAPKITMSTTAGGDSEARDIKIEDGSLMYSRDINAQGQALSVDYTAKLMDGKLEGTFEIDLGALGGAAGGLGGPTAWTATKAN